MAKRADRMAWRLVAAMAMVVLGGIGALLYQRASFNLRQTALVEAARRGDTAAVAKLLDQGAQANAPGSGDWPLPAAIWARQTAVVKLLMDHGASATAPISGFGGATPLMVAAHTDSLGMVKLLLARGAKANSPLPGGDTILNAAADFFGSRSEKDFRHAEIVRLLVANGADPNVQDARTGDSPLKTAAMGSHPATAQALLDAGANPNVSDKYSGTTPLMWAARHADAALVRSLVAHGAKISMVDRGGMTVLMHAASGGNPAVVKLLLAHRADASTKLREGGRTYTALDIGRTNHNEAVVQILNRAGLSE